MLNYFDKLQRRVNQYRDKYEKKPRKAAIKLAWWNFKCMFKKFKFSDGKSVKFTVSDASKLYVLIRLHGGLGDKSVSVNYLMQLKEKSGDVVVFDVAVEKKFFDDLSDSAFALTNLDDKSGLVMLQNTKAKKFTYSLRSLADFKAKILESHFEGTDLLINDKEVFVHFTGRFNAYNLLAVYGAAVALGKTQDEILIAMSTLYPVAGRFETIHSPLGYTAIVDYAHTPDALTNVLNSINEVLGGKGRVITVVGAGGNRDKGKRPLMAREAFKSSDQLILTSDNPRFEDPEQIIQDMTAGLTPEEMTQVLCVTDRAQAIKTATMLAQKGDVILIAGKGHEDYQEVKGVKHHFDDREQIRQIFSTQKRG